MPSAKQLAEKNALDACSAPLRTPPGIENQLPLLGIEDHLLMAPRTGTAPYQLSIERWHCRHSVEKPRALWFGAVVLRNAVK